VYGLLIQVDRSFVLMDFMHSLQQRQAYAVLVGIEAVKIHDRSLIILCAYQSSQLPLPLPLRRPTERSSHERLPERLDWPLA
jgi:hypothetical protein